jgi:polysaccharide biosynthesis protein PslG
MVDLVSLVRAVAVAAMTALAPAAGLATAGAPEEAPVAAVQDRASTVGVGSHKLDDASIARLRDLGLRHVRVTLYWGHWVEDPAYRQVATQDLQRALAAGLTPLVVAHGNPWYLGWERRQEAYREYADFMASLVAQFPQVRYWQLWNEMDQGFTDIFGADIPGHRPLGVPHFQRGRYYAESLALAYPAIKAANPQAVVVAGGIAGPLDASRRDNFLEGMYAGNAQYDVLAIHSYGFPLLPAFRERGRQARVIMRRHGDTRPLWNTEFGLESAVVAPGFPATPADIDRYHLDAWRSSVEANARERIYDRIYGHVLQQGGDLSYDLIRSDGSPRPAYSWLRSWLRRN